ncbi:MAG: carboxypeptidase-like regulatory domain-containing protein [Bacteroidales bacterium]
MIKGYVKGAISDNKNEFLPFANIHWLNTDIGVVADASGYFEIEKQNDSFRDLVVSFVGYKTDTVRVKPNINNLEIILNRSLDLDEVVVTGKQDPRSISVINPLNVEVISSDGLQRLACCSLAESFETTATVDVGYTDAVTEPNKYKCWALPGSIAKS